jgi:hypothetical protein
MDGIALKPLTVSFSEPGFLSKLNQENQFGPWFTLSDTEKQQLGSPMGPQNPQALNRYSYVLNNPMRWTDPSGHYGVTVGNDAHITLHLSHEEVQSLTNALGSDTALFANGGLRLLQTIGKVTLQTAGVIDGLLATTIGAKLLSYADTYYGGNGVDITLNSLGAVTGVTSPTINRQTGIHFDPAYGTGVSLFVDVKDATLTLRGESAEVCGIPNRTCQTR